MTIELRHTALSLAIDHHRHLDGAESPAEVVHTALEFESYLKGEASLDGETKARMELVNSALAKRA